MTDETVRRRWRNPCCDRCGNLLGETVLTELSLIDDGEALRFCSQHCADRHFEAEVALIEQDDAGWEAFNTFTRERARRMGIGGESGATLK